MPFPSGLLPREIIELQARYPIIGKEKEFAEQQKKALAVLKEARKSASQRGKNQADIQECSAMNLVRIAGLCLFVTGVLRAQPLIDFPTDNRALLQGRPRDFYMYVNRDFEGARSQPWQGGQFGFVRGPVARWRLRFSTSSSMRELTSARSAETRSAIPAMKCARPPAETSST